MDYWAQIVLVLCLLSTPVNSWSVIILEAPRSKNTDDPLLKRCSKICKLSLIKWDISHAIKHNYFKGPDNHQFGSLLYDFLNDNKQKPECFEVLKLQKELDPYESSNDGEHHVKSKVCYTRKIIRLSVELSEIINVTSNQPDDIENKILRICVFWGI